jgi:ABC-2 type transport system permease protein
MTQSNPMPEGPLDSQTVAPAALSATRPLYWSVRRELWENRSVYLAPLVVAAVILCGFLISAIRLPHKMRALSGLDPAKQREAVTMPFNAAGALILLTAFIVGVFYCLDALHGERRDRSILFWKSLPVSDFTTVLSKASIPLVVLPLITFVTIVATQMVMLVLSTARLLGNAPSLGALWTHVPLFQMELALLYALVAIALWHAPIYGWLLLVSGWARRATFLWAVLPLLATCVFEGIAFRTSHFASLLGYRLFGWFTRAFVVHPQDSVPVDPLRELTPVHFLTTPGLWIGLGAAAILLAAAVRVRRNREPI